MRSFREFLRENLMPDEPKGSENRKQFADRIRGRRKELRKLKKHSQYADIFAKTERNTFLTQGKAGTQYLRKRKKLEDEGETDIPRFDPPSYKGGMSDLSSMQRLLDRDLEKKGVRKRKRHTAEPQSPKIDRVSDAELAQMRKDRAEFAANYRAKRVKAPTTPQKLNPRELKKIIGTSRLKPSTFASLMTVELGAGWKKKPPKDMFSPLDIAKFYVDRVGSDRIMTVVQSIANRFPGAPPKAKPLPVYRAPGRPRGATMKGSPEQVELIRKLKRMSKDAGMQNAREVVKLMQLMIHRNQPGVGVMLARNDQTFNKLVAAYEPKVGAETLLQIMSGIAKHRV